MFVIILQSSFRYVTSVVSSGSRETFQGDWTTPPNQTYRLFYYLFQTRIFGFDIITYYRSTKNRKSQFATYLNSSISSTMFFWGYPIASARKAVLFDGR